jgi:hypothetical protein
VGGNVTAKKGLSWVGGKDVNFATAYVWFPVGGQFVLPNPAIVAGCVSTTFQPSLLPEVRPLPWQSPSDVTTSSLDTASKTNSTSHLESHCGGLVHKYVVIPL